MVDLSHNYERLYCPNEIKVFCRLRDKNSNDIIAYPSYLKDKKIRNIGSCKAWVDDTICTIDTPKTFTNEFITGYKVLGPTTLDWYDHGHIELLDPRGFIICITMKNFFDIISKTNIINNHLQATCKFAFTTYSSTNVPLRLITTDTPIEEIEYVAKLLHNKVKTSDLKVGYIYVDKSNHELTYLGKIKTYELKTSKIEYIFVYFNDQGKHNFYSHKDTRNLAFEKGVSAETNIEELLEEYTKTKYLYPLSNFGFFEVTFDETQYNGTTYLYRKEGNKIYYTNQYMTSNSLEHALNIVKGNPNLDHYKRPIKDPAPLYSLELGKDGFNVEHVGDFMSDIKNIDKYSLGSFPFCLYEDGKASLLSLHYNNLVYSHNNPNLINDLFKKRKSTILI